MKQLTKLASLLLLTLAITAAVSSCRNIKNSMTVTPTWYQTDYKDFDLIFVDRKGRIENIVQQSSNTLGNIFDREIIIVKDGKTWRVAETWEETVGLEETTQGNTEVIKVALNKIKPYRRTQH